MSATISLRRSAGQRLDLDDVADHDQAGHLGGDQVRADGTLGGISVEVLDHAPQDSVDDELAHHLGDELVAHGAADECRRRAAGGRVPDREQRTHEALADAVDVRRSGPAAGPRSDRTAPASRPGRAGPSYRSNGAREPGRRRRPLRSGGWTRGRSPARRTPRVRRRGWPPGCPGCRGADRFVPRLSLSVDLGGNRAGRSPPRSSILRRSAAQGRGRQDERHDYAAAHDAEVAPQYVGGLGMCSDLLQSFNRVRHRKDVTDRLQPAGHLLTGDEQSTEEDLRDHHDRHELDRLELGPGERAAEQAQARRRARRWRSR